MEQNLQKISELFSISGRDLVIIVGGIIVPFLMGAWAHTMSETIDHNEDIYRPTPESNARNEAKFGQSVKLAEFGGVCTTLLCMLTTI